MKYLRKGRYLVREAVAAGDIAAAQALRCRAFRQPDWGSGLDADSFDADCTHILIEEVDTKRLVCCFRVRLLTSGRDIPLTYAAQFYDLSALLAYPDRMAELGRFCIDPADVGDPDILRIAWGALTQFVDAAGVKMLFGCSSFSGTETESYRDAFALLNDHLAPQDWQPREKSQNIYRYARLIRHRVDERRGLRMMPPLLRTYLIMGGWVSDHAVLDRELNTMHVFTGLEIDAVPAARARLLRQVGGAV